mgnify:CR=1 FL=1
MADITKCTGRNGKVVCPKKETCWRFLAPDTPQWQSYMNAPIADPGDECGSYWEARLRETRK